MFDYFKWLLSLPSDKKLLRYIKQKCFYQFDSDSVYDRTFVETVHSTGSCRFLKDTKKFYKLSMHYVKICFIYVLYPKFHPFI